MKYKCVKTLQGNNDDKGINAIFRHRKIRKGKILEIVEFKGDKMLMTKKGNLVCRCGSSLCERHFTKVEDK